MQNKYIFTLFSFILILASCTFNNEDDLYGDIECDSENVTFSADIQSIVATNCATIGCHVAGGQPPILESYDNIKAIVDNGLMEERVIIQRNMPPGTILDDCVIEFIEVWINEGAPNN